MPYIENASILQNEMESLAALHIEDEHQPFEVSTVDNVVTALTRLENAIWASNGRGLAGKLNEGISFVVPNAIYLDAEGPVLAVPLDTAISADLVRAVFIIHGIAHRIVLLGADPALQNGDSGAFVRLMIGNAYRNTREQNFNRLKDLTNYLGDHLPAKLNEAITSCLTRLTIMQSELLSANREQLLAALDLVEEHLRQDFGYYLDYQGWGDTIEQQWQAGRARCPGARHF